MTLASPTPLYDTELSVRRTTIMISGHENVSCLRTPSMKLRPTNYLTSDTKKKKINNKFHFIRLYSSAVIFILLSEDQTLLPQANYIKYANLMRGTIKKFKLTCMIFQTSRATNMWRRQQQQLQHQLWTVDQRLHNEYIEYDSQSTVFL